MKDILIHMFFIRLKWPVVCHMCC